MPAARGGECLVNRRADDDLHNLAVANGRDFSVRLGLVAPLEWLIDLHHDDDDVTDLAKIERLRADAVGQFLEHEGERVVATASRYEPFDRLPEPGPAGAGRARELVRPHLRTVTVAAITSTVRGLSTEVPVGAINGITRPSVVSCDSVTTIPVSALGEQIGVLLDGQEAALCRAIRAAFDLD